MPTHKSLPFPKPASSHRDHDDWSVLPSTSSDQTRTEVREILVAVVWVLIGIAAVFFIVLPMFVLYALASLSSSANNRTTVVVRRRW